MQAHKYLNKYGYCNYCYKKHSEEFCNTLELDVSNKKIKAVLFKNKIIGGPRLCTYCATPGHTVSRCEQRFIKYRALLERVKSDADAAFAWLHQIGFGPGAMLSGMASGGGYTTRDKGNRLVCIEPFNSYTFNKFMNELLYGKNKNWFYVNAVEVGFDKIRKIYLPFNPMYSPKPTSVKVEVIHKANESDIEDLKAHLLCYTSPVIFYEKASDFFNYGYKFNSAPTKYPKIVAPTKTKSANKKYGV